MWATYMRSVNALDSQLLHLVHESRWRRRTISAFFIMGELIYDGEKIVHLSDDVHASLMWTPNEECLCIFQVKK